MASLRRAGLTLIATLWLSPALAGEFSAVINGRSFHLGATSQTNEANYGLGLEYQFDTESRWKSILMVNGFRDSEDAMSFVAGGGIHRNLYTTDRLHGFYVDAGINAFLMTREDVNDNKPFPGALPSLTVGNRYMGFNFTYLPKQMLEKTTSMRLRDESIRGVVFVQFKVSVSQLLVGD